ncbi:MAG: carboxypeptidase-like regulatory domain-containing protein [Bacteroidaceae bacterium]|nr:carboxypeptidase-like regulatory domain-containing protein [Bacteroidaceae bacterium]
MKRLSILCSLALSLCMFQSCKLEENEQPGVKPSKPEQVVNGEMKNILLSGIVKDTEGNPVADVTVSTGSSVATTNASGLFSFSKVDVVEKRSVVRFTKSGYFDVVRSVEVENGDSWNVVICKKDNSEFSSKATYASSAPKDLEAAKMKVSLKQNGYVTDATGKEFFGEVNAEMVYLDPNNENFADMMPGGDLAAVRTDGSEAQLVSYGMTAVNLTDNNGNKLQLKDGQPATLSFPIPEGMTENPPSTIPLWSFNESTGLWEEEGEAILVGDVYVGQVHHFSWWNLDYPEKQGTVEGYVKDALGNPIKGITLHVGQVTTKTDSKGYYKQAVPADTDFEIVVRSADYGNYKSVHPVFVSGLDKEETRRVDITLPALCTVSGRIVNNGGGSNIASVWVSYGNQETARVVSKQDGNFAFYAPEGFAGTATLYVQTMDGDIITKEITLGNGNIYVGDIVISSATGSGGQMAVKLSDGSTATLNIVNPADNGEEGGVVILDNRLVVMAESESETNSFGLQIEDYDAGKTSYANASVVVTDDFQQLYSQGNTNVTVNRKSGKFVFGLNGTGYYYNQNGVYDTNAAFVANNVTIDLYMAMKSYRNVHPKDVGAPTFTPVLSAKAPLVAIMSEGKMGTGAVVYYNGTKSDFQTLKAQASKSGITKVEEDEDDGYIEIMYYSRNKLIMLEYDPYGKTVDDDFDAFGDDDSQIYVAAAENVPASAVYSAHTRSALNNQIKAARKGFMRSALKK